MTPGSLHTIPIREPSDPRIPEYANLKDAALAARDGLFIAEGPLVVRELLRSRFITRSVLIERSKVEPMRDALAHVPGTVPIYEADQSVIDSITGFHLHRGVLACGQRIAPLDARQLIADSRTLVILEGLSNHDNVGGIFRTTAALGGPHAAVLLSPGCCDPLYRKALRVSIGHALRVPFTVTELDSGLWELLAARGFPTLALTPDPAAQPLQASASERGKLALVLGAEGPGLQPRTLDQIARASGRHIRIPMTHGVDSLNVVVAAGIALSRLAQPDA